MGHVFYPTDYDRSDVLVATHAVNDPEVADLLPTIKAPVLLVCGDKDHFACAALYEQTARLIPGARLIVYAGKGHLGTLSDPRLAPDILNVAVRSDVPSTPASRPRPDSDGGGGPLHLGDGDPNLKRCVPLGFGEEGHLDREAVLGGGQPWRAIGGDGPAHGGQLGAVEREGTVQVVARQQWRRSHHVTSP